MELGKLTAVFDADTRKFDTGMRGVQNKLSLVKTELQAITTSASPAVSSLSGVSNKMGILAGASVIAATAIGGVVTSLASLIKSSAEAGGELFDLSQKTNFTVETLSGLSIVAKTTGSDIKGLSASLGIFQKNMEAAGDATTKQGELFKRLGLDTRDNEKALRQAFTQLNKLGDGAKQTAVAMQLFGRSGKDVLAIVKETNGNLDEAIKKYDKMGLIITHGAAAASDKFNDVLEETTLQLSAVTRSIGMELLPVATEALQSISFWLQENKGQWAAWGTTISDVIRGVRAVAQSEIGSIIGFISDLGLRISGIGPLVAGLGGLGQSQRPGEDFFGPGGAGRGGRASLPGTPEYRALQRRLAGIQSGGVRLGGGGGGGRGGGGSARQDPGVQLLQQLQRELANLTPKTEAQKQAEALLSKEYAKTTDEVKKKIQITAADIDAQKMILAITRERVVSMKTEREELEAMVDLVRQAGDQGLPFFTRRRTMNDLTGLLGTDSTRPRSIADNATRPRIATVEEQVMRERIQMAREQMQELAGELTGVFARAVGDGFERGAKRGFQSLALGLLDIVQNIFLRQLEAGLTNILSQLALGTGGSGGWAGKLGNILLGGLFGGVGGAVGGGGGAGGGLSAAKIAARANGGPVLAGLPYRVHKDEMIVPTQNGMVYNKAQQGNVNNYYIQLPQTPKGGYSSPSSQRELASKLVAALQGAQT